MIKLPNFEEWLQKVVWYGHRSGDYISKTNYSKNKKIFLRKSLK